jgi:diguanylate cyclase (GGDEF)-like protein
MKLTHKINLAVISALLVGSLFFYARGLIQERADFNTTVLNRMDRIEELEGRIDEEVLQSAFFLYHNYDRMNGLMKEIEQGFSEVWNDSQPVIKRYPDLSVLMDEYRKDMVKKRGYLHDFQTVNSSIKNSQMYIPLLVTRYLDTFGGDKYFQLISDINASIFLARNSLDKDLAEELRTKKGELKGLMFTDSDKSEFNRVFLSHVDVFIVSFPGFAESIRNIIYSDTKPILGRIRAVYAEKTKKEYWGISYMPYILLGAFIGTLGLIVRFMISMERAAVTDRLTGLLNRFSFEEDKSKLKNPILFLINIDNFTQLNNFYGTDAGDAVLKDLAGRLVRAVDYDAGARIYRLGGDDFGILLEDGPQYKTDVAAESIIDKVEKDGFLHRDVMIRLNISIGISREQPLLEKADMALKEVKKGRLKFLEYREDFGLYKHSERNLSMLSILKDAINRGSYALLPAYY